MAPRPTTAGSAAPGLSVSATKSSSNSIGFGGIDTGSHDEVLMLLVKLNLCLTAVALGVLLFLLGGKLRRWRSSRGDRRVVNFNNGSGGGGGSWESVAKKTGGAARWRAWRERLAASARPFSKQTRKERQLERELSDYETSPMHVAAANMPASVTHFHWSPAPARATVMASPPSPPLSPVEHQQQQHHHEQQQQHQQLQQQQQQQWQQQRQRPPQQRRQQQFSTPGTDTVTTSSSSGGSVLSLGAASAASSAALLTCRCLNADLRLYNTPASSEFSLPTVDQLAGPSLQPPPTPQTPFSGESVVTTSSC